MSRSILPKITQISGNYFFSEVPDSTDLKIKNRVTREDNDFDLSI